MIIWYDSEVGKEGFIFLCRYIFQEFQERDKLDAGGRSSYWTNYSYNTKDVVTYALGGMNLHCVNLHILWIYSNNNGIAEIDLFV